MQTQIIKLVENNPELWKLMNESKGVTMAQKSLQKSAQILQHINIRVRIIKTLFFEISIHRSA